MYPEEIVWRACNLVEMRSEIEGRAERRVIAIFSLPVFVVLALAWIAPPAIDVMIRIVCFDLAIPAIERLLDSVFEITNQYPFEDQE